MDWCKLWNMSKCMFFSFSVVFFFKKKQQQIINKPINRDIMERIVPNVLIVEKEIVMME